jgi:hypothetical protein
VSSESNWTIIRLASDLGITTCIAAGNSCCNLDDGPQFDNQDAANPARVLSTAPHGASSPPRRATATSSAQPAIATVDTRTASAAPARPVRRSRASCAASRDSPCSSTACP